MNKKSIIVVTQTPKGLDGVIKVSPSFVKENYCAVVNVSDSSCATFDYQKEGIPSFWFPINEIGHWGYYPFFGTLKVLNEYYDGRPILLHCHAGANRSPSIAYAILLSKGYSIKEIENELKYENISKVFDRNIQRKHIPDNIIDFLKMVNSSEKTLSLYSVLRNLDVDYEEYTQRRFEEQNNYVLKVDGKSSTRLIYSKEKKKFILVKEEPTVEKIETPWVEPKFETKEWYVTPLKDK